GFQELAQPIHAHAPHRQTRRPVSPGHDPPGNGGPTGGNLTSPPPDPPRSRGPPRLDQPASRRTGAKGRDPLGPPTHISAGHRLRSHPKMVSFPSKDRNGILETSQNRLFR